MTVRYYETKQFYSNSTIAIVKVQQNLDWNSLTFSLFVLDTMFMLLWYTKKIHYAIENIDRWNYLKKN